jgi:hypothetical protein
LNCRIEGGLLPHPNGIIHPKVRTPELPVVPAETLSAPAVRARAPVLAGHVDIGAGAKVLKRRDDRRACGDRRQCGGARRAPTVRPRRSGAHRYPGRAWRTDLGDAHTSEAARPDRCRARPARFGGEAALPLHYFAS